MSQLLTIRPNAIVPVPRVAFSVRPATADDIPFMDELQKKHQKMLGFMPRKTLEGKIGMGHVLIAEHAHDEPRPSGSGPLAHARGSLGYVISQDRYMGRDDVGVIYQMNVAPVEQRKLIGATLVKTIFDRAAYGCKLFCCWCAQDIPANHFWESLGFVPLAFRAGARAKARIHIFWQRRVREDDTTTPYWFPAETRGGMMNEARLVLPIPPGTHWSDAKPIVLPGEPQQPQLAAPRLNRERHGGTVGAAPKSQGGLRRLGGWRFVSAVDKPPRQPRPKAKNDPKLVAAARELRDRWMEEISSGRLFPCSNGKYEVSRALPDHSAPIVAVKDAPALPAPQAA